MANQKFIKALNREPQNCPPVWFMRQAGRYHQLYQEKRTRYSFMDMCKNPQLAAEVALDPIRDFDFDVSIMFSDLLFPLEALGFGLDYVPGPQLGIHLCWDNLDKLKSVDEAFPALEFQGEVLKLTREMLPEDKSLIGFVGGLWTLYTYAVEGAHKGHLLTAKSDLNLYSDFCQLLVPLLKKNIQLQLDNGAEVVMVFDTAAGELDAVHFKHYVEPHLKELSATFPGKLGYYAKGIVPAHIQSLREDENWAGFGFDHRWDLREEIQQQQVGFVQGNFDQALLFADTDMFKTYVDDYLQKWKAVNSELRKGWVSGLGHGVLPETPEDHVRYLVNRIREVLS